MHSVLDGDELPDNYPDIGFFEIDRIIFKEEYQYLGDRELGSLSLSRSWYQRNRAIYTVLMQEDRAVGYINILPVTVQCFEDLRDGTRTEGEIEPQEVLPFFDACTVHLYIAGLAILPDCRKNGTALRALLRKAVAKYSSLHQRGIVIGDLGAVAWSSEGERFCEKLGLTRVQRDSRLGPAFRSSARPVRLANWYAPR